MGIQVVHPTPPRPYVLVDRLRGAPGANPIRFEPRDSGLVAMYPTHEGAPMYFSHDDLQRALDEIADMRGNDDE